MKREQKAEVMDRTTSDLNKAKDCIFRATEVLEETGMTGDAERLMKVIYKIEAIQNKYDRW